MLHGDIAALVGRGAADDRDLGRQVREMQPGVLGEIDDMHDLATAPGRRVHFAAVEARIDERVQPDLGQYSGTLGGGIARHVVEHAGGQVIGGDLVAADHLPDRRRRQRRGAARERAGDDRVDQAGPGQMIDALHAIHVAGRDRREDREAARLLFRAITLADRLQHEVRAIQPGRRADRHHRIVGNELGRIGRGDDFLSHDASQPQPKKLT